MVLQCAFVTDDIVYLVGPSVMLHNIQPVYQIFRKYWLFIFNLVRDEKSYAVIMYIISKINSFT